MFYSTLVFQPLGRHILCKGKSMCFSWYRSLEQSSVTGDKVISSSVCYHGKYSLKSRINRKMCMNLSRGQSEKLLWDLFERKLLLVWTSTTHSPKANWVESSVNREIATIQTSCTHSFTVTCSTKYSYTRHCLTLHEERRNRGGSRKRDCYEIRWKY